MSELVTIRQADSGRTVGFVLPRSVEENGASAGCKILALAPKHPWDGYLRMRGCPGFRLRGPQAPYFSLSRRVRVWAYFIMAAWRLATPAGSESSGGSASITCLKAASSGCLASG